MRPRKRILLLILALLTITSLLLAACGPVEKQHGHPDNGKDHVKDKNKDVDQNKENDSQVEKILICHKTGSAKHPYVKVRVANDAARGGHGTHAGDLIPAPAGGCPKTAPVQ